MNTDSFNEAKAIVLGVLGDLARTEVECRSKDTSELKLYNLCWAELIIDSRRKISRLPQIQSAAQLRTSLRRDRENIVVTDATVFTANVVDKASPKRPDSVFHIRRLDWPRSPIVTDEIREMHPMLQSFFVHCDYNFDISCMSGDAHIALLQITDKHMFFKHDIDYETGRDADSRETGIFHAISTLSSQPLDGFAIVQNGKMWFHGTTDHGEFWAGIDSTTEDVKMAFTLT